MHQFRLSMMRCHFLSPTWKLSGATGGAGCSCTTALPLTQHFLTSTAPITSTDVRTLSVTLPYALALPRAVAPCCNACAISIAAQPDCCDLRVRHHGRLVRSLTQPWYQRGQFMMHFTSALDETRTCLSSR
jgi:hypothetical protein